MPAAASDSFCEYGSSFSIRTLCFDICLESVLVVEQRLRRGRRGKVNIPPFVVLPAPVLAQIVLLLKVLCALNAVVCSQRWPVFVRNERLELGQLARVAEVAVHLIDVAAGGRGWVSIGTE